MKCYNRKCNNLAVKILVFKKDNIKVYCCENHLGLVSEPYATWIDVGSNE